MKQIIVGQKNIVTQIVKVPSSFWGKCTDVNDPGACMISTSNLQMPKGNTGQNYR